MQTKNKQNKITPKRLSGFNDFFGWDMRIRQFVINTFIEVFEKYGYEPLETPALEYSELMLGQSGEEAEKQYYRFTDNGGRDVMLKFEVMISMCRAVAQNMSNISFPYKRYQIQRVWRAEKVQKGRYREITQCDADTIGSWSMACDAEFIQMGLEVVERLGFKEYVARISNRKFLQGLAEYFKIPPDKFYGYAMSIDKFEKIGREAVVEELVKVRGIDEEIARQTMELLEPGQYKGLSFKEAVESFRDTAGASEIGKQGLDELLEIENYLTASGVEPKKYKFDPSIARGLASYTGPVWEFEIMDGNVGSIAGCGRYDNAIKKYTGIDLPATGGSFGIERICDIIKDRGMWDFGETPAQVLVTVFSEDLFGESLKTANTLRAKGIPAMLYPDPDKLAKQFKYADKKGIKYVIVMGPDEKAAGKVKVKNMESGEEKVVGVEEIKVD